ncbi:MAG: hypothetical protein ACI9UN_002358 [Granulosicoccus sp.]|jgi:hypothetical protein
MRASTCGLPEVCFQIDAIHATNTESTTVNRAHSDIVVRCNNPLTALVCAQDRENPKKYMINQLSSNGAN